MITCEYDPDVVRWGLHLLDGDPSSNPSYYYNTSQSPITDYEGDYEREAQNSGERSTVENDEIIAHALQEELSQLAVEEASGSSHVGQEHLQASILAQDWLGPSRNIHSDVMADVDQDGCQEEEEDTEPVGSSSSPENKSSDGEDSSRSLELTDEFALDGELCKRLNQMVPVPHVPRINGEIPSVDEEISDHQRLVDRLQLYDLIERKVEGDGNCQFRALSDQFYRSPEHHKFVREQVVNQLSSHADIYGAYVPMAYDEYLIKLSRNGEWGDHVTLQAAADKYGVKICVITSFKDTCFIEILPNVQKSKRVIFLSFWAEVHYNSIYPAGDSPTWEETKKKRRMNFREQMPSICTAM
ncbi:hypothetical protein AMTRI_Chr07g80000 [Amborella trichopoda]|uniref:ubiquitinyl hydrolase 1 n=1 Tax=Amborella trichopoda TaxID=13333 RepID=W1NGC0_AMBTC|nr:OTU domain-containing protein DDB_G0284757 [Amborella trichopoda]XP_020527247.1 OTU domain-containing protein DDB_G0284757 [Amborella trichopoda]XP_020527254.1 OTU domain-containing protein DDB_G0284757 [Amborella trichopoda]ERM94842.1 hypothetical protein AMTR_s00009p00082170 [Amborella trichopoda]|eukprot:XP_006827426.1 OTU domain-containing protein DDB_G0284757 [Amborella trichopoda]